jgi:hypothetical protein
VLPPSAARDLFALLVQARARWYEADRVFTGMHRSRAASSGGPEDLAGDFTLLTDRGRSVTAAALECVLAELPSDAVIGRGAAFLACFAPLTHAAALRAGRDGYAVLVAAVACPRRELSGSDALYVHRVAPAARDALRVFRGLG